MNNLLHLIELVAASWYLAYVLTQLAGPYGAFKWIRENTWHGRTLGYDIRVDNGHTKTRMHDGLLDCIICTMPWVSLALWLINSDYLTMPFAIAGLALWAHAYSSWVHLGRD